MPSFASKLQQANLYPLKPTELQIFQVNAGKMCNQTCQHCHVDAGPTRKEIMNQETFAACLKVIAENGFKTVDITGGAPEMNPHFRWFVEKVSALGCHVMVRCNLTIILANPKFHDLPVFFKQHKVEVISSLPHFTSNKTDRQRGEGVFAKSIEALKMLNAQGYGLSGSDLKLNLVYNPSGAFLPGDQVALEREFKQKLLAEHGISFHNLYCITNIPISRYLEYLLRSENFDGYMAKLVDAFNPQAAQAVMCRNTLSVGWDGQLFDCDFNQMLGLKVATRTSQSIFDFDQKTLMERNIVIGNHCYACTAGSGSSCGGATT